MMSYLTRPARELIETGQLKFASDLVNPDPRKDVIEIDAINSFMKRNPRADGGRIEFDAGGDVVRLKALQADYDKFGKKELNKAAKTLGFEDIERESVGKGPRGYVEEDDTAPHEGLVYQVGSFPDSISWNAADKQ